MDWTTVKSGDQIEPAVIGHRVWRYRLGPPLVLLSFCLGDSRTWPHDEALESDKEPNMDGVGFNRTAHGVHAFKTLDDLRRQFNDLPDLLRYRAIYEGAPDDLLAARYDGVVRGTVALWGTCIDHERGYRAQYARPASFDEAHGERADEAIDRLRRLFGVQSG